MRLCSQPQLFQLIDARSAPGQVPKRRLAGKLFWRNCKFVKNIGTPTPDSLWIWIITMEHIIKYSNKLTFHLIKRVEGWTRFTLKPPHPTFPDTKLIVH
jgi:hypothetical protein